MGKASTNFAVDDAEQSSLDILLLESDSPFWDEQCNAWLFSHTL